jgi:sugar-specific transcriptional regulator TrmB
LTTARSDRVITLPLPENLVKELATFGLTENEAKTYLALIQLKQATARTIAKLSNIPRQEIYRILLQLEKLELTEVAVTKPAQFIAVDPQKALTELIENQKETFNTQIAQLEAKKKSLENELTKIQGKSAGLKPPSSVQFVLISGRHQVNSKIRAMLEKAVDTVRWASPKLEIRRAIIYDRDEMLRKCAKRGVKIRILTEADADNIREITELSKFCEVRHVPGIASLMTIIDDKEIIIGSAVHSSDEEVIHELWTNDAGQVETMKDFFERVWADSKPAATQIKSIRTQNRPTKR